MSKGYREPSVSGSYPSVSSDGLETKHDDVLVVVTQAFDGHGNNMIREGNVRFDGFPGVSVWVELPDGRSGEVSLSPIHGDSRKTGLLGIDKGTLCKIKANADAPELVRSESCVCGKGTYHRIYLSPKLEKGEIVLICDVWGCHRSRIIDESELLSWVEY